MILNLIRTIFSGGSIDSAYFFDAVIQLIALLFVLFCCLPIHEYAHAWAATKLGDQTAQLKGRLTLNPFAHLDLWGSLMMLFVGIGYAKPVPVNPYNMRCGSKKGYALTSLAGPVSNLILAFIFSLCAGICKLFDADLSNMLNVFFNFASSVNIMLAVFNLLPIPPLDGFNIIQAFLPDKVMHFVSQYHVYIRYALLFAVFFGFLTRPIGVISAVIAAVINFLAALPIALFQMLV
ncbi:MAG: site-2 protease family protein [Oscillospiraceae bacterium]|nr:site-2 protease family protein [Oscillospiraceae bacterium]